MYALLSAVSALTPRRAREQPYRLSRQRNERLSMLGAFCQHVESELWQIRDKVNRDNKMI